MSQIYKNINNQMFYQYIQDLYNHIRIASALSIIRSKPENISLKEYILIIQNRIENKSHTILIDNTNELFIQQQGVLSQIEQFVSQQCSTLNGSIDDIFNDDDDEINENNEPIILENNSQFIQSILQIKSLLHSSTPLAQKNSHDNNENDLNNENNSSFLRYTYHFTDSECILTRSVEHLCDYLYEILTGNNCFQIISNWKGSLSENAIKLLLELLNSFSDNYNFINISFNLIKKLIMFIETRSGMNKQRILEKQCNIIFEISGHKQLCSKTINYLLTKITDVCTYLTQTDSQNLFLIDAIEKSFNLFNLTEKLIGVYVSLPIQRSLRSQTTNSNQTSINSVTQLWQASWQHLPSTSAATMNSQKPIETDEHEYLIWKPILERGVVKLMDHYPLHCFILWNCINLLHKLEVSIESSSS